MGQPIGGPRNRVDAYNPNNGAVSGDIGGDFKNLFGGPGVLSLDAIGTYERDAVNISMFYPGQVLNANGTPITFPATGANKATLSDQTAFMALAKYSFGSWGAPAAPIVAKGPVPPSGPVGVPLTIYAGYEWIRFASPSDPQNNFNDDGYTFLDPTALTGGHGSVASINLTSDRQATHSTRCAEPAAAARTKSSRSSGSAPNTASPETWISSARTMSTFKACTRTTSGAFAPYRLRTRNAPAISM